jgi:hypothetical protein
MTSKTNSHRDAGTQGGIVALTNPQQRHLELGAKVAILQHKHLKCAATGHIQAINGAYNYVRPDNMPVSAIDPTHGAFELYPNEIRILAVYRHDDFKRGTVVRIKNLDWGKVRPKSHGLVCGIEATRILVQPIGARKGALISLPPEDLLVERNDGQLSADALVAQLAIIAVLRALGSSVSVSALKSLLATQQAVGDIDAHLARLANQGKIRLTESQVQCIIADGEALPDAEHLELHSAIDGLAQATRRLADAVHTAIVQAA